MMRKFKATLRIKPGFANSMSIAELKYFITITHGRCSSQGYKFRMKSSTWGNDISFFDIKNGPCIWFVIKDMIQYEKKTSGYLEN